MENNIDGEQKTLTAIINSIIKEVEVPIKVVTNSKLDEYMNKHHNNIVLIAIKDLTEELFQTLIPENTFLKETHLSSIQSSSSIMEYKQIEQLAEKINKEAKCKSYCFLPTGLGAYDNRQKLYDRIIRQTSIDEKKIIFAYISKLEAEQIRKLNREIEKLCEELADTLLIITGISKEKVELPLLVVSKKTSPTDWKIRLADRKEYFEFRKLADQFQKLYRTSRKDLFPTGVTYLQTEFYSLCEQLNDSFLLMYEQDNKVIGFIEGQLVTTYGVREFNDHRIMRIVRLFVAPEYRRQKVGTRLVETLCQYAHKRKCDRLETKTYHFCEEAMRFMESLDMNILSVGYEKKLGKK